MNLRKDSEQSLLVGPGRGMVTSTGRIVFTAYEFTKGDKNSAAIYSDDKERHGNEVHLCPIGVQRQL